MTYMKTTWTHFGGNQAHDYIRAMSTSLPTPKNLAGLEVPGPEGSRPQCLSSNLGSEVNDAFPTALALDAPAGPNQDTLPRTTSGRVMELIRRNTDRSKPGGNGAFGREQSRGNSPRTAEVEAAAAEATNKADGQRSAVPPKSPRPSKTFSLRRKLSDMFGLGARVLDWQPHEKVLKVLGYRPRGYGRPFTDSYTLSGVLGTGGFGVVREGAYKADGEVCAVKVIPREAVPDIDVLVHEVDILKSLDHHQIVRFVDFYEEPQTYYLVLEKVPGGELFERIISEGRFGEGDAKACVRSLLEALEYCHSRNVAHRDIKPENILFARLDVEDRTIKLADFGLARRVADGLLGGNPCGTPSYMAPESLRMLPHGTQVDCWGAGIVTHILLGGYAPFSSSRTEKLFRLIKKGRVSFEDVCWRSVTQQAKDFVLALLKVDPDTRLTVKQALRHPWLTESGEGTGGGDLDLAISLENLKVFNAKRKFRMAIHAMVACQQLHGWASMMKGVASTTFATREENGRDGNQTSGGGRGNEDRRDLITAGLPSLNASMEGSGSTQNRRWTSSLGTQNRAIRGITPAQPRPTGYERRRFFASERKGTGIFSEKDWTASIGARLPTLKARQPSQLMGGANVKRLCETADKRAKQELDDDEDEDEEEEGSSGDEK